MTPTIPRAGERVRCPWCPAQPKRGGLVEHVRRLHGPDQAFGMASEPALRARGGCEVPARDGGPRGFLVHPFLKRLALASGKDVACVLCGRVVFPFTEATLAEATVQLEQRAPAEA